MPAITPMPFTDTTRNTESQPWPLLCRPGVPLGQQVARRLPRR
ncbi:MULTISPECIES: hypothetical protein [Pseudomonas]|nr:hypothetical protein [Pseudomonas tumuqii]